MKVTKETKISKLIKYNSEVIERIASINKNFNKLKNPILRKVLAGRVSISDAARIGKVSINEFVNRIADLGFEYAEEDQSKHVNMENENTTNNDLSFLKRLNKEIMDVRPILEKGIDPFDTIYTKLNELPFENVLLIINSFEPIPLINKLNNDGYIHFVERDNEGNVLTYLKKDKESRKTKEQKPKKNQFDFNQKKEEFEQKIKTIDVRHLEMPEPMVTILEEIENLVNDHALFVHHKKVPQFLLPELEERGYVCLQNKIDKDNIDLLIFK